MRLLQNINILKIPYYFQHRFRIGLIVLLGFIHIIQLKAEGTKEIMPYDTCLSRLNLEPSFTNFAMYGCTPEERLNIRIANIGEKIYYGFGDILDANQMPTYDLYYRLKDPNGNIVVSQAAVPTSGTGYISTYTKAITGPNTVSVGGYSPLSYTSTTTGDYYLEFYYANSSTGLDRREIKYIDITVTDTSSQRLDGRVWSNEWQFTVTASPAPNPYDYPFYGELYIYSDDSIVTSVDFNGIKPYVFAVTANPTGCTNTGNIIQDRKSQAGKHTYPQYKIFLNDPDSIVFPSGIIGGFSAPTTFSGCPGNYCIDVSVNKSGAIQLLIDLNGTTGYQIGTQDIMIVQNLNTGTTCIPWNGLDGLGNPVVSGTQIKLILTYVSGLTHMPIYDAESNPNGYKIGLVRPQSSTTTFNLFWDDSNFPAYTTPPSTGCVNPNGCHTFYNMFGDIRTINTWWYAATNIIDSLEITYSNIELDSLVSTNASCPNINDGYIEVFAHGGGSPYLYSINSSPTQSTSLFPNLGVGNYNVTITDTNNCVVTDTISVQSTQMLTGSLMSTNDTCNQGNGSITALVNSGAAPFQYIWNTTPTNTTYSLTNMHSGYYTVTITDAYNCIFSFSDSIINIPSSIQIIPLLLHDTCSNNMGEIILSVTNATPPTTYLWNTTPPQTTANIYNLSAGIYTVTITENNYCQSIETYTIQDMPAPIPLFSIPNKACVDDSILIQYIGNQTPPDNFQWHWGQANIQNGFGLGPLHITYNQIGLYYITLDVSKIGCPSSSMTDSIMLYKLITSIDSLNNVSCFGENDGYLGINVMGGNIPYNYIWNSGGSTSFFNNQLSEGQYTVSITDSIGCKDIISANISEPALLEVKLQATDASCTYSCDGSIIATVFGGTSPYSFDWTPNGNTNQNIDNICKGNYTVTVTDSNNCMANATSSIGNIQNITADFTYNARTNFSEREIVDFTFTGIGANTFSWDFGDFYYSSLMNPTHQYNDNITYTVTLIANSGVPYFCQDTAIKNITVLPPFNIYIPTAFTPNGDGINDVFNVIVTRIKEYHIFIYNRWGKQIFVGNSLSEKWDGKYNEEVVPDGVYTYLVNVIGEDDKAFSRKGTIVLYR